MTKWLSGLLAGVLEKLLLRLVAWVEALWAFWRREKNQEPLVKKQEENIKTGAKRDEKTRKDEQDFLNS